MPAVKQRKAISAGQTAKNQGLAGLLVAGLSKLAYDLGHGELAVMAAPFVMAALTWVGTVVRNVVTEKGWARFLP